MLFDVVYSYDCNVLRAQCKTDPTVVRFVHFMITGRKLRPFELEQVAVREFSSQYDKVSSFVYLTKGQGCPGTDRTTSPRGHRGRNRNRPYRQRQ